MLNIPVDEIRMLNPQYRKDIIPGDYRPYLLTLPTQQCLSYVMSEKRIVDYDADRYARRSYVEPGENSEPEIVAGDNGVANLAQASRQTANAQTNNEIAQTQMSEKMVVKTHVVTRGESIRDIARQYGVSATDIKRWNQLRRGKVKEGDKLKIEVFERVSPESVKVVAAPEVAQVSAETLRESAASSNAAAPAATSASAAKNAAPAKSASASKAAASKPAPKAVATPKATRYKVRNGDTLEKIARKHGTTVAAIQSANGLGKSTNIRAGQSLKIPAKKATAKKRSRRRR